jgi:hypothetical protein
MRFAKLTAVLVLAHAQLAMAHHSGAMFDQSKTVELTGTIKEYQFSNPHVWIEVMVPDKKGKPAQWSIEGEAPQLMARIGLKPKALQAGDKVTLRAHPLRDGRTGGSFISITLADGKTIGAPVRASAAVPTGVAAGDKPGTQKTP